jgi:glycosyltransferase involved in cell wall biosynthesis
MGGIDRISVIAAMRNEAENIESLVSDLAAQDFDGEMELLIADGASTDGSAKLLRDAAGRAGLEVHVLQNPARWVSPGLNACIRASSGDLLVRVDCHSRYPSDYVRRSAQTVEETDACAVTGRLLPEGETRVERAIACAMDSPFGGIGWTRQAHGDRPVEVDTLTFGVFRREAFDCAGLFDESLIRNQDDEFTLRLRRAGKRLFMDPGITVRYRPRGSLRALWRQYYEYGLWKIVVMRKHRRATTARSLAPLAFVVSLAALGRATPASVRARALLGAELTVYGAAALGFGLRNVSRRAEPRSLLPLVIVAFPTMHLAYGVGMVHGCLRIAARGRGAVAGAAQPLRR